jgi:hypothetical protein
MAVDPAEDRDRLDPDEGGIPSDDIPDIPDVPDGADVPGSGDLLDSEEDEG